jgi:hypothetical protein
MPASKPSSPSSPTWSSPPTSSRALERLQALGLKCWLWSRAPFADVQRVLGVLGPVLGTPDTGRRLAQDRAGPGRRRRSLPPALRGTRVYFEVSGAPYAASESSFIGELLTRLAPATSVPAALGPFPKLNPEFVVRADPEVIFVEQSEAGSCRSAPAGARSAPCASNASAPTARRRPTCCAARPAAGGSGAADGAVPARALSGSGR